MTDVCRVCLQRNFGFVNLFTKSVDSFKSNAEILEFVTKLMVPVNSEPQWICIECLSHLSFSYKFIQKCVKSARALNPPPLNPTPSVSVYSQPQPQPHQNHTKTPKISNICDPITASSFYGQQSPARDMKSEGSSSPEILITASDCEVNIHENISISDFLDVKIDNESPSPRVFSSPSQETVKKSTKSFCRFCKKVFLYSESRNRHEREAHLNTEKRYKCEIQGCGKVFKRNYVFKHHMNSHQKKNQENFAAVENNQKPKPKEKPAEQTDVKQEKEQNNSLPATVTDYLSSSSYLL